MEFVAFLENLGDGICWVFIVCWESLDGHMVVMVKFTDQLRFLRFLLLSKHESSFLAPFPSPSSHHLSNLQLQVHAQGYPKKEESLLPSPHTITLQVLTLFIGTALDILHFRMSAKVFVFELICTFICQVQLRLFRSCFFSCFPQLPLLGLLLLLHFLYLGPFSPPLMISILMYFVMITAEVAVKICQLHSQNTVDYVDLVD